MIEYEAEPPEPLAQLAVQNFSYSRIKTYEECQLRFFYQYVIKIPQEYGVHALLGNVIHQALEVSTNEGSFAQPRELHSNYRSALLELDPEGTIPSDMVDAGSEMLSHYIDDLSPEEKAPDYEQQVGIDVFTELKFTTYIGKGKFNGFIDHVKILDADNVVITDYKSGKHEVAAKNIHNDLQLGIYSLVMNEIFPDKNVYAQLYYLRSRRKKGHLFSRDDLSIVKRELTVKVDTILQTEEFRATENPRACYWCSYATDGTCSIGAGRVKKPNR